jgi:hypothetical protein
MFDRATRFDVARWLSALLMTGVLLVSRFAAHGADAADRRRGERSAAPPRPTENSPRCPASFAAAQRAGSCAQRETMDLRCAYLEGTCACSAPQICSGVARPPAPPSAYAWRCEARPPAIRSDGCPGVQPRVGTSCHGTRSCGYGRCGGVVLFCDAGHWRVERMIPPPP